MKKRSDPHLSRRGIALAAAAATLWVVCRTADLGAAQPALLSSGQLVTGLLELQMGRVQEETSCLNGWSGLVVDQSPVEASAEALPSPWSAGSVAGTGSASGVSWPCR